MISSLLFVWFLAYKCHIFTITLHFTTIVKDLIEFCQVLVFLYTDTIDLYERLHVCNHTNYLLLKPKNKPIQKNQTGLTLVFDTVLSV